VSLVERSRSKCAFLKSARAVAGLRNTTVSCCSAEELETTADVVVFRALCAVDGERARMLAGLLRPGGAVVAYKGTWESVAPEAEAARESFGEVELIPVEVPMLSEERYLLVLRSSRASS
jgi:16S rRNA (guanine527-N7)-methyltransferase